jgi:Fe-S cluster biogenesis protein NfuA
VRDELESALAEIRTLLREDGGDVELVELRPDGVAILRLKGSCDSCPPALLPLRKGIEALLREKVEGLAGVVMVD